MLPNSTSIKEFIQLLRDSIVPELPHDENEGRSPQLFLWPIIRKVHQDSEITLDLFNPSSREFLAFVLETELSQSKSLLIVYTHFLFYLAYFFIIRSIRQGKTLCTNFLFFLLLFNPLPLPFFASTDLSLLCTRDPPTLHTPLVLILLMHYLGRIALSLCWGLWLPYLIPFTSQGQDESIALPPREEMAPIDSIEGIKQTEREERISFILLQLS